MPAPKITRAVRHVVYDKIVDILQSKYSCKVVS